MTDLLWDNILKRLSLHSRMIKISRGTNKKFHFQSTTVVFTALAPDFDQQGKVEGTEP